MRTLKKAFATCGYFAVAVFLGQSVNAQSFPGLNPNEVHSPCDGHSGQLVFDCSNGEEIIYETCELRLTMADIGRDEFGFGLGGLQGALCEAGGITLEAVDGRVTDTGEIRFSALQYGSERKLFLSSSGFRVFDPNYRPPTPAPRTSGNGIRCVTVSGDCTGLDCIIDKITLSGGPGDIDNSWSTPMVCSGYNGALNGTYNYVMETNFDRVCSGSFQISSQAQSGVTVNIYDNCSAGYVSEY